MNKPRRLKTVAPSFPDLGFVAATAIPVAGDGPIYYHLKGKKDG
ncbi:MAG: hypothetical protein WAL98_22710 [Desulfatiglandaceae bacterium]